MASGRRQAASGKSDSQSLGHTLTTRQQPAGSYILLLHALRSCPTQEEHSACGIDRRDRERSSFFWNVYVHGCAPSIQSQARGVKNGGVGCGGAANVECSTGHGSWQKP